MLQRMGIHLLEANFRGVRDATSRIGSGSWYSQGKFVQLAPEMLSERATILLFEDSRVRSFDYENAE